VIPPPWSLARDTPVRPKIQITETGIGPWIGQLRLLAFWPQGLRAEGRK